MYQTGPPKDSCEQCNGKGYITKVDVLDSEYRML